MTRDPGDYTLYEGAADWSALYYQGNLVEIGDHYWVQEKLLQDLGVETVDSDDFLQGGNRREDAAKTLSELKAYTESREEAETSAATLREKAKELIELAEEQEARARGLS